MAVHLSSRAKLDEEYSVGERGGLEPTDDGGIEIDLAPAQPADLETGAPPTARGASGAEP